MMEKNRSFIQKSSVFTTLNKLFFIRLVGNRCNKIFVSDLSMQIMDGTRYTSASGANRRRNQFAVSFQFIWEALYLPT